MSLQMKPRSLHQLPNAVRAKLKFGVYAVVSRTSVLRNCFPFVSCKTLHDRSKYAILFKTGFFVVFPQCSCVNYSEIWISDIWNLNLIIRSVIIRFELKIRIFPHLYSYQVDRGVSQYISCPWLPVFKFTLFSCVPRRVSVRFVAAPQSLGLRLVCSLAENHCSVVTVAFFAER